ncbi:hypothetical protein Nmel_005026, partial [Mimus melanotis]
HSLSPLLCQGQVLHGPLDTQCHLCCARDRSCTVPWTLSVTSAVPGTGPARSPGHSLSPLPSTFTHLCPPWCCAVFGGPISLPTQCHCDSSLALPALRRQHTAR